MRTRTPLLGLALVAASSIGLVSCSAEAPTTSDGSGTLTITAFDGQKPGLDPVVAAFEDEYPEIDVRTDYVKVEDAAVTRTQLTSGTASDVLFVQPGNGTAVAIQNLVPGGFLEDLSERPFAADVPDTFDVVTSVDGKLYFLPVGLDGIVAIYNKAAFAELGVDLPETIDDVFAFCAAAKEKGKVAFALGAQTPWVNLLATYAFTATLVFGENPEFDDQMAAGEATFADSRWHDSLQLVLDMQEAGCYSADPLGTPFESTLAAVGTGEAIATVQVTPVMPAFKGAAPEGTEFGAFALPATNNAEDTWVPLSLVGGYAVNAAAENPVAARMFLDFLAQPEVYTGYLTTQGSFSPLPIEGFEPPAEIAFLADFIAEGRTYPWMDQLWPNAQVQPALIDGTQGLLGGNGSIDDVLSQMDVAYTTG